MGKLEKFAWFNKYDVIEKFHYIRVFSLFVNGLFLFLVVSGFIYLELETLDASKAEAETKMEIKNYNNAIKDEIENSINKDIFSETQDYTRSDYYQVILDNVDSEEQQVKLLNVVFQQEVEFHSKMASKYNIFIVKIFMYFLLLSYMVFAFSSITLYLIRHCTIEFLSIPVLSLEEFNEKRKNKNIFKVYKNLQKYRFFPMLSEKITRKGINKNLYVFSDNEAVFLRNDDFIHIENVKIIENKKI